MFERFAERLLHAWAGVGWGIWSGSGCLAAWAHILIVVSPRLLLALALMPPPSSYSLLLLRLLLGLLLPALLPSLLLAPGLGLLARAALACALFSTLALLGSSGFHGGDRGDLDRCARGACVVCACGCSPRWVWKQEHRAFVLEQGKSGRTIRRGAKRRAQEGREVAGLVRAVHGGASADGACVLRRLSEICYVRRAPVGEKLLPVRVRLFRVR